MKWKKIWIAKLRIPDAGYDQGMVSDYCELLW